MGRFLGLQTFLRLVLHAQIYVPLLTYAANVSNMTALSKPVPFPQSTVDTFTSVPVSFQTVA